GSRSPAAEGAGVGCSGAESPPPPQAANASRSMTEQQVETVRGFMVPRHEYLAAWAGNRGASLGTGVEACREGVNGRAQARALDTTIQALRHLLTPPATPAGSTAAARSRRSGREYGRPGCPQAAGTTRPGSSSDDSTTMWETPTSRQRTDCRHHACG